MTDFAAAREAMVRDQLAAGGIRDRRVLAAMGVVPREEFVPGRWRALAYEDGALPIGHEQTISQPWVVAAICEGLELGGEELVLEIGAGSGYSAAVLARLAARIVAVELVPELAARAAETLARVGVENVSMVVGDGTAGPPPGEDGPYDAIAVHAASPEVPPALAAALRPGGRMVIPIAEHGGDMLTAFRRTDDGAGQPEFESRVIAACRFVPLIGEAGFRPEG